MQLLRANQHIQVVDCTLGLLIPMLIFCPPQPLEFLRISVKLRTILSQPEVLDGRDTCQPLHRAAIPSYTCAERTVESAWINS